MIPNDGARSPEADVPATVTAAEDGASM